MIKDFLTASRPSPRSSPEDRSAGQVANLRRDPGRGIEHRSRQPPGGDDGVTRGIEAKDPVTRHPIPATTKHVDDAVEDEGGGVVHALGQAADH